MKRMTVTMDLIGDDPMYDGVPVDATFVREYVANADNLLVPGVTSWTNVQASMPDPATILVEADIEHTDVIVGGDWSGQEVGNRWIADYIIGAADYFIAQKVLMPTKVTFQD